jgi:hypothetical protein
MANRPLFYVDFNELMDFNIVLLSQTDIKKNTEGNDVRLFEGLPVSIYSDDVGVDGKLDNLVAEGIVVPNRFTEHFGHVKWCCQIDQNGIRHQSDITE